MEAFYVLYCLIRQDEKSLAVLTQAEVVSETISTISSKDFDKIQQLMEVLTLNVERVIKSLAFITSLNTLVNVVAIYDSAKLKTT